MLNIIPFDGKPISKPGFYSDVPSSRYHSGRLCAGPSISSSGLRCIWGKSEAHFWETFPLNPDYDRSADEDTEALVLGRAVHHLLLGMPNFKHEFSFPPDSCVNAKGEAVPFSLTFKSAREWVEKEKGAGRTVLTVEQGERIKGMAQRLAREPLVRAGVLNGLVEITMAWRDSTTGVWLLSRPDVIPTASGDFCDLKTIGKGIVSYADLVRAIGDHSYPMQAALVREGWRALAREKMSSFSFYFVESRRPHCARMVTLREGDLDLGMRQCRNALGRFVKAMNSGNWPGPGGQQEAVQFIDLAEPRRMAIESELRLQGEETNDKEQGI